ncbi:MAG TPA: Gfo/Idh/MocA family oxidoreductase [Thermoanaerobaculia bacterium]|nr:Gfo/Idh/MocA family oxidoreductase [Thermoanaerobaculia bacterium]
MALTVGVLGTGALGRHHVRILSELEGVELRGIYDPRRELAEELAARHGTVVAADVDAVLADAEAVVIAAPTSEHEELARRALRRGRHVLVEKPMAASLAEADRMLGDAGDRVLAVGHVEFYNPAVQRLLDTIAAPRFVEIERIAPFTPRSLDVDVILDLMIHDLQIVHALDPSPVAEVRALGIAVLSPRVDIANARLQLDSGCVVNVTASRVSDQRVRRLRVFGRDSYHSLDYSEQTIKGFRLSPGAGRARSIEPADVAVERAEPLRCELEAFVARCRGERVRLVDGAAGRRALETALRVAAAVEAQLEAGPGEGTTAGARGAAE